jgi:hypothetical protein
MLRHVDFVRNDVSEECIAAGSVLRLLVLANVPSSKILVTLMIEAIDSSETLLLRRTTRRNILEAGILQALVYLLGPAEYIPPEGGERIESPKCNFK